MDDWAFEISKELYAKGVDCSASGAAHEALLMALRKAKADGMFSVTRALEMMLEESRGGMTGQTLRIAIDGIRIRADKIERGEA